MLRSHQKLYSCEFTRPTSCGWFALFVPWEGAGLISVFPPWKLLSYPPSTMEEITTTSASYLEIPQTSEHVTPSCSGSWHHPEAHTAQGISSTTSEWLPLAALREYQQQLDSPTAGRVNADWLSQLAVGGDFSLCLICVIYGARQKIAPFASVHFIYSHKTFAMLLVWTQHKNLPR